MTTHEAADIKYIVQYVFEGEPCTGVYCAHHLYLVKGDLGITVLDGHADEVCGECEVADAAFESDKRAEVRNKMYVMTTHEAADRLGITARSVARLIGQKLLTATKHGRDYWIEDAEVERYLSERRQRGRPQKG